jgi:hypothetical protein
VGRTDRELAILGRLVERARGGRSLESLLQDLKTEFDLGGLVLREASGRVLAAVPPDAGSRPAPRLELRSDTLFAVDDESPRMGAKGLRLPEGGVGGQRPGVRARREPDARDRRLDPRSRDAVRPRVSW